MRLRDGVLLLYSQRGLSARNVLHVNIDGGSAVLADNNSFIFNFEVGIVNIL